MASDIWPKYRAAWESRDAGWQVRRARRVSPGYFRLARADAQRYDDAVGNFPV